MKLPIKAIEIQKITNNNYKTYHEETEAIQAYLDKQEKAFSLHVVSFSKAQEYAEFVVMCEREGRPLLLIQDYLKHY